MQHSDNKKSHHKPTRFEYRVLWVCSFILVLPTITFKRLLPTQWQHWRRDKNIFTVVSEARELAGTITPMAFIAY